jgi:hypothetical protein
MHSNLMGPAGVQDAAQQAVPRGLPQSNEVGFGGLARPMGASLVTKGWFDHVPWAKARYWRETAL